MTFGKSVAVNSVYRLLHVITTFIITAFLTRLMGVSGYGLVSLMITNAAVFNLFFSFGGESAIAYHTASGKIRGNKIVNFFWLLILSQFLILVVTESASLFLSGHFWLLKTNQLTNAWPGFIFLFSISVIDKYSALFYGRQLFPLCNKLLIGGNLIMLMIFAAFYFFDKGASFQLLISVFVLSYLIQASILAISWHNLPGNSFSPGLPGKAEIRSFFSYSLIAMASNILQFLAYRIDYWILDYYKGEKELGWYSLAVRLLQAYWILPVLFASIIFAKVAHEKTSYDESKMHTLIRGMNLFNLSSGVILFFSSSFLIPWLFGKSFYESAGPFRILLPGYILFCVNTVLAAYFAGKNKLILNFFGSVICFLIIIVLDLLLIPKMGMKGAAIASSIAYSCSTIYTITVYMSQSRRMNIKLFIPSINDMKFFLVVMKSSLTNS